MDKNDMLDEQTVQVYAAIHLKVTSPDLPDWLNEMIDRSRKDDFAMAAMQGLIPTHLRGMEITLAINAHRFVSAMMEESKNDNQI